MSHLLCNKFEPELFTLHSSWPREHIAEKELLYEAKGSSLLDIEAKIFGVFLILFVILWKLHSMCPKELFELKNDLNIGPGGWTKTFQSTGRKFSENLSEKQCLLRKNILEGLFWKKTTTNFGQRAKSFGLYEKCFLQGYQNCDNQFQQKNLLMIIPFKKYFFIIFGHWVKAIVIFV